MFFLRPLFVVTLLFLFVACANPVISPPRTITDVPVSPTSSSPIETPTITPTPHWNKSSLAVTAEFMIKGLRQPVQIVSPFDGTNRLFVLQKRGAIRLVKDGKLVKTPFLDLTKVVASEVEQALQGMVFAPDFKTSRVFYVFYNRKMDGALVLARYRVSDDPDIADPTSVTEVMVIPHPRTSHHGGQLQFGQDGYLYLSVGDGGFIPGKGVSEEAQKLNTLLGKILRIDVSTMPYAVPPTNPFVNTPNARPEILAYGLRNPWRFFLDPTTNNIFIADVGEKGYEEVNVVALDEIGGKNFGWFRMEGTHCVKPKSNCQDGTLTLPVFEYPHAYGCAIVGGIVYRGKQTPKLEGRYLFSDYCFGRIWSMELDSGGTWRVEELANLNKRISAITTAEDGYIYISDLKAGELYRLIVN